MHRLTQILLTVTIILYNINFIQGQCERVEKGIKKCEPYRGCDYTHIENITCTNVEQMHKTPNLCIQYLCTIIFQETDSILRTNSFQQLAKLEQIYLNNTEIETIQSRAFSRSQSIRLIHLENNLIEKIPKNAFSNLNNLIFLNLSSNKIGEIEDESLNGCDSLRSIDLSDNKLKDLPSTILDPLLQLETLNLSRNSFKTLNPNWCFHFHSLKNLNFDHNSITSLDDCSWNKKLSVLSLSYNYLTDLSGTYFPENLKILNLKGNRIKAFSNNSFNNLLNLEKLDISNNKLSLIPFKLFFNLKNLKHLDMSSNNLMSLDEGVFHGLSALQVLNLSSLHTPDFNLRMLYSTKNIYYVDLSRNDMVYLDMEYLLKLCKHLAYLRLDGNSFTCQDLTEIIIKAEDKNINILPGQIYTEPNLNGIRCSKEQQNSSFKPHQHIDYFDKEFRNSAFYRFFSNFKYPNENGLREHIQNEKEFFTNISHSIESLGEMVSKNALAEKENHKKIIDTEKLFERLLKIMRTYNGTQNNNNLTSEIFTLMNQQSQAALSAENTDLVNLVSAMNSLKWIFILCILILAVLYSIRIYKNRKIQFEACKNEFRDIQL